MIERTRAWRRWQRTRIKARRKRRGHWAFHPDERLLNAWGWGRGITADELAARYLDTPTPCSCWFCGNPRRHFGVLPAQWRREALRAGEPEEEAWGGPPEWDGLSHDAMEPREWFYWGNTL